MSTELFFFFKKKLCLEDRQDATTNVSVWIKNQLGMTFLFHRIICARIQPNIPSQKSLDWKRGKTSDQLLYH